MCVASGEGAFVQESTRRVVLGTTHTEVDGVDPQGCHSEKDLGKGERLAQRRWRTKRVRVVGVLGALRVHDGDDAHEDSNAPERKNEDAEDRQQNAEAAANNSVHLRLDDNRRVARRPRLPPSTCYAATSDRSTLSSATPR